MELCGFAQRQGVGPIYRPERAQENEGSDPGVVLGVGIRRLFWIGAAALLVVAALISIVALLRGELTPTDGSILFSLAAAFLAGSAALSGLALIERRDLVPLGWTVVAASAIGFSVLCWQIWTEFDYENWSLDTVTVLVAALMVAAARLLHRGPAWFYWLSAGLTVVTAATFVWAIHADPDGSNWEKALGTLGILAVLAWFLVPVLGRTAAASSSERVVGRGPGRYEIELGDGETLVVKHS